MKHRGIYIAIFIGLAAGGVLAWVNRKAINIYISDIITQRTIATLHPTIQGDAKKFVKKAKNKGLNVRIYRGAATWDEQDELYQKYLAGGAKAAPAGKSFHNYKLAFDFVEIDPMYGFKAGYPQERWEVLGEIGEGLGFKWGKSFGDKPHLEKSFGYSTSELYALVQEGRVDKKGMVILA